jgi:hypothetical protein
MLLLPLRNFYAFWPHEAANTTTNFEVLPMSKNSIAPDTEILTAEDLRQLVGTSNVAKQIAWLNERQYPYVLNVARKPVVGRLCVRLKLCGLNPQNLLKQSSWQLDIDQIK